jgi:DNA-binding response OmpR family regulator
MTTILLADNDTFLLKFLQRKLQSYDYQVITAANGIIALSIINSHKIDIFITEIQLAFLSGLELVTIIKKQNKKIPIIILSNINSEHIIMQAYQMGVNDYIVKPFDIDTFNLRIKRILLHNI